MSHPKLENRTPYHVEPLYLADEHGQPVVTLVAKATFDLKDNGRVMLAGEQLPLLLGGLFTEKGNPESSYRFEPEGAFFKPATDVVLVGHAHPPGTGLRECLVSFQVGALSKTVRVVGDRVWYRSLGAISMTPPKQLQPIPLSYERAFGGWDRSAADAERHTFEPRNPVGLGFRGRTGAFEEGLRLPNLEEPAHPITSFRQTPPPAGFGFLAPHWQPRAAFAGTYDDAWTRERMPLLPRDFDRRFLNAASPGLVATGYLKGDEPVRVVNASPGGRLEFRLPSAPPPSFVVALKGRRTTKGSLSLDTVIVDTDDAKAFLYWRAMFPLRTGPLDVVGMEVKAVFQ
ncbi:DUF2169 domain-containing protein [Myxococcus xanthus]|uniref:DUF2169 family type VI secretion system accessory protein n=1 Tax=Myxococcus xanthus TaxID=34 RepID=UPI00191702AC|nr:DUF2169 domain-containing protein [Myxococcus xanthus]QQR45131.1 DUF2169 domain-containing protein [Myxococcus xanthus]